MFLFGPPLSRLPPSPHPVGGPGLLGPVPADQYPGMRPLSLANTIATGRGRLTRYQQAQGIQLSHGETTSGGCISMKGMNMM